ncbi:hypothetical protein HDU84_003701 [Entophlyctis sp. JEL0112]|nr:hypothetical protein HDU84_003701 [Entophlyctis sp. JEL0112]
MSTNQQHTVTATVATAAVLAASVLLISAYRRRERRLAGTLPITSRDVACVAGPVKWTKNALLLDGSSVPLSLASAEFHPWRVPVGDWEPILRSYKEIGLNCIRIYFHWGFHSPSEGVYDFSKDTQHDMDKLLTLCEKLRLFVIAAPGPYICAETQGGGHPFWLAAKKDIRLRHSRGQLVKEYDMEYSFACREWFEAILPIISAHQISENAGCVVLCQIENENFEKLKGLPFACVDDMRFLARVARDCGITVPLFHNDGFESGSWVSHEKSPKSVRSFGLDLYAYDKYVVFAPTSSPEAMIRGMNPQSSTSWPEWKVETIESTMDSMEQKVRGYGGCAQTGPMFIAEMQGGWFNHYSVKSSYDTVYDFYGEDYTRLIYDSSWAQGVTLINIYMGYGGTNWGTIGDPDVYTSYDYSAMIREYGFISGRARKMRLALSFYRSMHSAVVSTERTPWREQTVVVTPRRILNCQRISTGDERAELTFFRNFASARTTSYRAVLAKRPRVSLNGRLAYKRSFVALGGYSVSTGGAGLHLLFSTAPIHLRMHTKVAGRLAEVWVVQNDSFAGGEMAFQGEVWVVRGSESLGARVSHVREANASVVSFSGTFGWCALATPAAKETNDHVPNELLVLCLPEDALYTLATSFEEGHWLKRCGIAGEERGGPQVISAAWGAYGIRHDVVSRSFTVDWQNKEERVFCLFAATYAGFGNFGFEQLADKTHQLYGFPGLMVKARSKPKLSLPDAHIGTFHGWTSRPVDFGSFDYVPLELIGRDKSVPSKDCFDLGFASGHSIYRVTIPQTAYKPSPATKLVLSINARHRVTVYANNRVVGGHMTYSLQLLQPGSKQGPDWFRDSHEYVLTDKELDNTTGDNIVHVVVESFGLNRQPFVVDDVRNKRGIWNITATARAAADGVLSPLFARRVAIEVAATGVDVVSGIANAYNVCGFPDEDAGPVGGWDATAAAVVRNGSAVEIRGGCATPRWFKGTLAVAAEASAGGAHVPVRLHLEGPATAHLWVGGVYLARYYGNGDCVQHDFYLPRSYVSGRGKLDMKLLVYGRDPDDWVTVEAKRWEIEKGSWSGNLQDGGDICHFVSENF